MSGDTAWRGLVAAALLGTDRAGERPVDLPGPVAAAAEHAGLRLDQVDPATVLAAAALLDVARTAGRPHPVGGAEPVPEAPDETAPVARTSRGVVTRLLDGTAEDRQEWVDLLRARGLVVPTHALPGLLRLALADRALRAALHDVVGRRGRWVVGLDPTLTPLAEAWADEPASATAPAGAATGDASSGDGTGGDGTGGDIWRLGDLAARVRWLQERRRRDPAAARDAVVAVLPGLPATERAELLGALATGLDAADEDLLEGSLDDRAAAPRRVAAELLARLPRSAFTARARDRAAAHLRVARVGLRRHLLVDLPDRPFDAAALRDGLTEPSVGPPPGAQPPGAQPAGGQPAGGRPAGAHAPAVRGERALRVHQLLVAAPADSWVPGLAGTIEDLLRLPVADDRADLVHDVLAQVTTRTRDPAWASALLRVAPRHAAGLVPLLPPDQRSRAVAGLLRGDAAQRSTARTVLGGWARPWPADLTDAVVGAVRRTPADAAWAERTHARDLAALLGRRADPLTTVVDPGDDALLQQTVATLADRRQTIEETTA